MTKPSQLQPYSRLSQEELLKKLNSDLQQGLSGSQAEERLNELGKNEIVGQKNTWLDILLRQFKSPFIYLLFAAALIAFVVGENLDGFLIFLFILINTILGFVQEYKAENTLKLLESYLSSTAKVIRDGEVEFIPTEKLVPGDISLVEAGDKVPADMRVLELNNLSIDESVLTGESIPINKDKRPDFSGGSDSLTDNNMLYSGSSVVDGTAKCIVVATGSETSFGQIAKLTVDTQKIGGFEQALSRISRSILMVVLATLLLLLLANLIFRSGAINIPSLLIFAIALSVAVIPQALPLVMTVSLSRGAALLAKKKVIVRRLSAIEELGSLNVLCTDKTGTITENKLEVVSLSENSDPNLLVFANLAASVEGGKSLEPFDIALWEAISADEKKELAQYSRVTYIPFKPRHRRNGVLVKSKNKQTLIIRGAVEVILDRCQLAVKQKKEVEDWVGQSSRKGKRCLAVAARMIESSQSSSGNEFDSQLELESDQFKLAGVIAFEDPIKDSTNKAVSEVEKLGISLKVITGDSKKVAAAVSKDIGLLEDERSIITGFEFDELSEDEKRSISQEKTVFARFTPEQKYEVIEFLTEKNRVGFLGDGINDAPALKKADFSMVVANSSDIAREVSDVILLEKDLAVIADGIKEGRKVFSNTIKYLMITLSANFGNFYAIAAVSLFIDFLPMLPIQILLLNLLTDFPMIAVATDTVDKEVLLKPGRYKIKEILFLGTILGLVSTFFDFVFFYYFLAGGAALLQTSWFLGSVLTELVFIFSIRTKKFFVSSVLPSLQLLLLVVSAAVISLALPFTRIGKEYFHFEQIGRQTVAAVLVIVGLYFVSTEAAKIIYYKINS